MVSECLQAFTVFRFVDLLPAWPPEKLYIPFAYFQRINYYTLSDA
jgi:hypothetical protein